MQSINSFNTNPSQANFAIAISKVYNRCEFLYARVESAVQKALKSEQSYIANEGLKGDEARWGVGGVPMSPLSKKLVEIKQAENTIFSDILKGEKLDHFQEKITKFEHLLNDVNQELPKDFRANLSAGRGNPRTVQVLSEEALRASKELSPQERRVAFLSDKTISNDLRQAFVYRALLLQILQAKRLVFESFLPIAGVGFQNELVNGVEHLSDNCYLVLENYILSVRVLDELMKKAGGFYPKILEHNELSIEEALDPQSTISEDIRLGNFITKNKDFAGVVIEKYDRFTDAFSTYCANNERVKKRAMEDNKPIEAYSKYLKSYKKRFLKEFDKIKHEMTWLQMGFQNEFDQVNRLHASLPKEGLDSFDWNLDAHLIKEIFKFGDKETLKVIASTSHEMYGFIKALPYLDTPVKPAKKRSGGCTIL